MELSEHDRALNAALEELPKQPHSIPTFAKLGLSEYFYKHRSHLTTVHSSASSKQAISTAAGVSKKTFQEIQDGAAAPSTAPVKVEHVAFAKLKRALKTCRATLRAMDASASDLRKLSAALKAKAQNSADSELAALQSKRAAEVDLARAHFASFDEDFLAFLSEADLLGDATSDDLLEERAASAEAYDKKASEHLDCFRRIKATIKP